MAVGTTSKTVLTATGIATSTGHTALSTSSRLTLQSLQSLETTTTTSTANGGTQGSSATAVTDILVTADPVFIKYRDGDFTLSSGTLIPATPISSPHSNGGLSTGAKIGLGVAIPLILILVGIIGFFARRRKHRAGKAKNNPIQHQDMPPDYPSEYKAELHDPSTNLITSSEILGPVAAKAELQAPTHNIASFDAVVPELESPKQVTEKTPTNAELDAKSHPHQTTSELDNSPISLGNLGGSSKGDFKKQENTGPLTTPEEFAVPVLSPRTEEDEELEYQERRLRERREILAEKERLAQEEEELRRLKKSRTAVGSRS